MYPRNLALHRGKFGVRPIPRRNVLDEAAVRALLPHGPSMIFVDRVVGILSQPHPAILAEYHLDRTHPVFADHFPDRPLWPGVYIVEGLAQSTMLLLLLANGVGTSGSGTGILTDIAVRLVSPAPPGATLTYRADLIGGFGQGFRVGVSACIGRMRVAEGTLAVGILPLPNGASP